MSGKTAAILGATGMIGEQLLDMALNDPCFEYVRVIVRRPFTRKHPKLEVKLVDFKDAESFKLALEGVDIIFAAIGTTQKNVKGDKKLYREIDFDIPVNAARFGKETGVQQFVLVSAVGANSSSGNFYIKLKGDTEEGVIAAGIPSVHIMQPSQLLGRRKEFRLLERIVSPLMQVISLFLVGNAKKFKAIQGEDVAKAMVAVSKLDKKGVFRYTYSNIIAVVNAKVKSQK